MITEMAQVGNSILIGIYSSSKKIKINPFGKIRGFENYLSKQRENMRKS